MDEDLIGYNYPTESLPELDLSHMVDDMEEIRVLLEQQGVSTKNTRIERYIRFLKEVAIGGKNNEQKIFPNSADERFRSQIDWWLYVLREVHELAWILKGFKLHLPRGVGPKLKALAEGRDFAALDRDSRSRDAQFELRIASYFSQAGCDVDMSTDTDVIARTEDYAFYIECKRIAQEGQLNRRLLEATSQIQKHMPKKAGKRTAYGCLAVDITKVAFSHSGLTFGMNNDHSRDVIQKRLVEVVGNCDVESVFKRSRSIIQCWFQIHIPALILHPPTPLTRFSSYGHEHYALNRKGVKALLAFRTLAEVGQQIDSRTNEPRPLTRRKEMTFPAGTTFWLNPKLKESFTNGTPPPPSPNEEVVAWIEFNGIKYEFGYDDYALFLANSSEDLRDNVFNDRSKTALMICDMFCRRFPYEDKQV